MEHYFYPAIFHKEKKGGYWISFPDFPECLTQGEDLEDAYKMASDAIGLCIDDKIKNKEELPKASAPVDFILENDDRHPLLPALIQLLEKIKEDGKN